LPRDLLARLGGLAHQLLHFRSGLGRFQKRTLGKLVDAAFIQQPLTHQVVG
jgi:hypothetical protein